MEIQKTALLLLGLMTSFFCSAQQTTSEKNVLNEKETTPNVTNASKAELILEKTINSHGGDLYSTANYSFIFRGDTYSFKNDNEHFEYSKQSKKEKTVIQDFLKNDKLIRVVNGDTIKLSAPKIKRATGALNSVIYFATLPHKLNDKAVNATYVGETVIKNESYTVINITFNQENGGDDFEDQFHYWINTKTNKIDYLAYNYQVNGGGVRFRSAYNKRVIDGVTFLDYINYKAKADTALKDLPKLYEAGELKELSKIKTENIINLKNKHL